jgi:hypothetical protein
MALLKSHLAIPGDYDGNGFVDTADYVLWRKTINQTTTVGTGADGNGNGLIEQSDYEGWRQNLGKTRSAYYSAAAGLQFVPEPSSWILVILAAIFIFAMHARLLSNAIGFHLKHRA